MLFDHELRYDAHGATAGGENAVDGRAHEPGAAGAVDERVSVGGQAMPQLMGCLPIALRNLTRGGGVDCDVHEGRGAKRDYCNPNSRRMSSTRSSFSQVKSSTSSVTGASPRGWKVFVTTRLVRPTCP